MSADQERATGLKQSSIKSADNDPVLQAYARFWGPYAERAVIALERIARDIEFIRDYK